MSLFFIGLLTLAIAHSFFIEFSLYWRYLWLDIPVHLLGGIVVALGVAILPFFNITYFEKRASLGVYILIVLSVGVVWEVFESVAVITIHDYDFWLDTSMDLCMDVVGGYIGYGIVKNIKNNV